MDDLVPGRSCGECTVCCTVLLVDTPEIQKEPGATCRHCRGGCTIYDTRPPVCRDYFCAWRKMDIFGENWRPDRSGVFAQLETEDIPEAFGFAAGLTLMLTDHPARTVRQRWFQEFVRTGIMNNIPIFLSVPGPRGTQAAKLLLNTEEMRDAILAGRMKDALEKTLRRMSSHDFKPARIMHAGNDVGVP